VAATAPATPATSQPTSVTTIMFGPGAACASAKRVTKVSSVIHRRTSTTNRFSSGTTVMKPPTETADRKAR
jgi:hypothetical protein